MRALKKLLLILIVLSLLFLIVGFFLPQQQHVERSVNIAAPVATVYQSIDNPKSFNEWSPWAGLDPDMKIEFIGPESGEGSGMTWASENANVGAGSWTITRAVENEAVDVALEFDGQGGATSFFHLSPDGGATKITWGFDTDAGMNPMMRWFGLMMDKWVGSEYEKGLNTLKAQLEKSELQGV